METFAAILTAILFWAFVAYVRIDNLRAARKAAGELLAKSSRMSFFELSGLFLLVSLTVIVPIIFTKEFISGEQAVIPMPPWYIFLFVFIMLAIGWTATTVVYYSKTEFRRHDIVSPKNIGPWSFLPWSKILFCQWLVAKGKLFVQTRDFYFQIKISAKKIEELNAVLVGCFDTRNAGGESINAGLMPFEYFDEPLEIKRRYVQFDLKTALLFMVVASSAFAWLGIHLNYRRVGWREQEALAQLKKSGVNVGYNNGRVDYLFFEHSWNTPSVPVLNDLPSFDQLRWLSLSKTLTTDSELIHIESLSRLTTLDLGDTHISDLGLMYITHLKRLEKLDVEGTKVTDDGLAHLTELQNLVQINLADTPITDAGLEHISKLENLKHLTLSRTRITDSGLKHLQKLTRLETLIVSGTRVTEDGIAKLRKELPQLKFIAL